MGYIVIYVKNYKAKNSFARASLEILFLSKIVFFDAVRL